MSTPEPTND